MKFLTLYLSIWHGLWGLKLCVDVGGKLSQTREEIEGQPTKTNNVNTNGRIDKRMEDNGERQGELYHLEPGSPKN